MNDNNTVKEQKALYVRKIDSNLRAMQVHLKEIYQYKLRYKRDLKEHEKTQAVYRDEVYQKGFTDIRENFINAITGKRGVILNELDSMFESVTKRHELLDLEDVKISNALKIIEAAGSKITLENIKKLVSQFEGDQAGLQILKQALEGVDALPLQIVNNMVYEPVTAFHKAKEVVWGELNPYHLGSINLAAYEIARLAKFEGFEFNTNIDPDSLIDAVRKGAGLQVD